MIVAKAAQLVDGTCCVLAVNKVDESKSLQHKKQITLGTRDRSNVLFVEFELKLGSNGNQTHDLQDSSAML